MTAPATPSDYATMADAAAVAGKSWERFRKIWPTLVRTRGFPAPFEEQPYRWDWDRLRAWRDAREAGRRAQLLAATPANDDTTGAPPPAFNKGRAAAGRARLMQRMGAL